MKKYVRFNYFEVTLVMAETAILNELDLDDGVVVEQPGDTWNMTRFLDYLMVNKSDFKTTVDIGSEYSEIEIDSYKYDENRGVYSFQLSKLRETNIPSKKRFGEIKEDILLSKDEYIGEFNSFIYDPSYDAVVLQSNLYGLTVKQTEAVLTSLRFRYLDRIGRTESSPLVVKLVPIIDRSKINRVAKADYYKKVRVKGADFMLDADLGDENLMSDASRLLHKVSGLNIDLTISLGRSEKTASLNPESIQKVIEQFNLLTDNQAKPQIEITSLYNEDSDVETINLIEPRMTDKVAIYVEPRQTVAHDYLYQTFIELYDERRPDVRRVLRPI